MKSVGPSGDEKSGHPDKDAQIGFAGAPPESGRTGGHPSEKAEGALVAGSISSSARHCSFDFVFAFRYLSPSSVSTGSATILPSNLLRSRADRSVFNSRTSLNRSLRIGNFVGNPGT